MKIPRDVWCFIQTTRLADGTVRTWVNGTEVSTKAELLVNTKTGDLYIVDPR